MGIRLLSVAQRGEAQRETNKAKEFEKLSKQGVAKILGGTHSESEGLLDVRILT